MSQARFSLEFADGGKMSGSNLKGETWDDVPRDRPIAKLTVADREFTDFELCAFMVEAVALGHVGVRRNEGKTQMRLSGQQIGDDVAVQVYVVRGGVAELCRIPFGAEPQVFSFRAEMVREKFTAAWRRGTVGVPA